VSFLAFFLIVVSLLSFVAAQLILKRAMEATTTTGFRNTQFVWKVIGGILLMTISFFLTLGLLQRFDLSYLYPFQGLSVIFITLMAAVVLKEKLNTQLAIGALLISVGSRQLDFWVIEFRSEALFPTCISRRRIGATNIASNNLRGLM
jgi:uncharacterized membrane protein